MTVIAGPGELVSLVPTLLGFAPEDSVVIVLLREEGRLGALLRVDLAELLGDGARDAVRELARAAMREGARRAVVLAFSDDEFGAAAVLDVAVAGLQDTVASVESWVVAGERFYCPDCADPLCCPPGGRLVPPPVRHVGAVTPRLARDPGASRASAHARRLAARAARRAEQRRQADVPGWRLEGVARWRRALDEGSEVPAALGRLAAALGDVLVRDAVLLMLVPDADQAVEDAVRGHDSAAVAAALGERMRPHRPPDVDEVARMRALLLAVLEHAPRRLCAPPAGTLAVIAWWEGDADLARAWCAIALDHDPGYRLALLTLALIESA